MIPYLKITDAERETRKSDPQEFCNAIEDVCGDQKSKTVKVVTAKLLCALCDNIPGFYTQMMVFSIDAIQRSLKEHVPTNLSFTANSPDDGMADTNPVNMEDTNQPNPEQAASTNLLFTDPDLE